MEMVSASKMRRAQRNVLATRPYADRLRDVMSSLMARSSGARTGTLLEIRPEVKSVALIVITPDRGLAGSLVGNLLPGPHASSSTNVPKATRSKSWLLGKKVAISWLVAVKTYWPK